MQVLTTDTRAHPQAAMQLLQQQRDAGESEHGVFVHGFVVVTQRGGTATYEVMIIWQRSMDSLQIGERRVSAFKSVLMQHGA